MKIIKDGKKNWDKPWVGKEGKCYYCGCIFLLDESDKPEYHSDQREGDHYSVRCPSCNNIVYVGG